MTTVDDDLSPDAHERMIEAFHAPRLDPTARDRMLDQALQIEASPPTTRPSAANTGMRWAVVAAAAATMLVVSAPLLAPLLQSENRTVSAAGAPELQQWEIERSVPIELLDPLDRSLSVGDLRFAYAITGADATSAGVAQVLGVDRDVVRLGLSSDAEDVQLSADRIRLVPYWEDDDTVDVPMSIRRVERDWLAAHSQFLVVHHNAENTTASDPVEARAHPGESGARQLERVLLTDTPEGAAVWIGSDRRTMLAAKERDGRYSIPIPALPEEVALLDDGVHLFVHQVSPRVQTIDFERFDVGRADDGLFEALGDRDDMEKLAFVVTRPEYEIKLVTPPTDGRAQAVFDMPTDRPGLHALIVDHNGKDNEMGDFDVLESGAVSVVDIPFDRASQLLHAARMPGARLEPR